MVEDMMMMTKYTTLSDNFQDSERRFSPRMSLIFHFQNNKRGTSYNLFYNSPGGLSYNSGIITLEKERTYKQILLKARKNIFKRFPINGSFTSCLTLIIQKVFLFLRIY